MRWLPIPAALMLAATTLTTSPSGAGPADDLHVRTVHRAYGDGPVRVGAADILKVRFTGKHGDRVRLDDTHDCPVSLRGPDGEKVSKLPSGFWRLTQRGHQTFTLTRCPRLQGSDKVQLEKLRSSRLVTNGAGTRLGTTRGFVDAVRVKVPRSGELKVFGSDVPSAYESRSAFEALVLPDGSVYPSSSPLNTFYFEGRRKISTPRGQLPVAGEHGSLVTEVGDKVLLLVDLPVTVWQSTAIPVATSLEGPALTLPATDVPYREYQVEFDAVAGDYVHAEVLWPTDTPGQTRLVRPDGRRLPTLQAATTGRHRLMVLTSARTGTTQVRIRTITQVATQMPLDGTHVTLTADEPGEWVLAHMSLESGSFYRLYAHSVTASGHWEALATSHEPLRCGRGSGNGCGDWAYGTVAPEYSTSGPFGLASGLANPWLVLLRPDPGVTASVELSVSPSTMSRISRTAHP